MGPKRKRPASRGTAAKKRKTGDDENPKTSTFYQSHGILKHYFARVATLRAYLVSDLSSRTGCASAIGRIEDEQDSAVAQVLDSVVVGSNVNSERLALHERRARDVVTFTQQLPGSTIGTQLERISSDAQLEIVDFIIWVLFRRSVPPARPQHLLAQGFDRYAPRGQNHLDLSVAPGIPGIVCRYPNSHVNTITSTPWSSLLALLGKGGDIVMVDLLLECCLFSSATYASNSLAQFSGAPLSSLQPDITLQTTRDGGLANRMTLSKAPQPTVRTPAEIKFVRNRMYFAQSPSRADVRPKFGLHGIHVLNRYVDVENEEETIHILKHVFPRQFRLHNVFTSPTDPRESALPFKDYTVREVEIRRLKLEKHGNYVKDRKTRVPRRLAQKPLLLLYRLRKLHTRCSYAHLLTHYCALSAESASFLKTKSTSSKTTDLSTPASKVSAFCQAVIKKVIPTAFWGADSDGERNRDLILKRIDQFICARKFESFSLQSFLDGLRVSSMDWLVLPHQATGERMSQSDFAKRKELLAEFVYYLVDSFLMPLVRSNFHVTESNNHRNRLFYFRHDIWSLLCEPAMAEFKANVFEQVGTRETKTRLAARTLGFSTVRLLPKAVGFRPITNLRRRPYIWVNGKRILGRSINSALGPAFRALTWEKSTHTEQLGNSLFSVREIHPRLKDYASRLEGIGQKSAQLYMAKVDVQACFDSIPQESVLELVNSLFSTDEYLVSTEACVKLPQEVTKTKGKQALRSVINYSATAAPADAIPTASKTGTSSSSILVAPLGQASYRKAQIQTMISEHVSFNLIKIGKKYYRQKAGIPQGSVLSCLLCNLFYGSLENRELDFTCRDGTLLLRFIDDFLLVSTEKDVAERFLKVMHKGLPEYGMRVKPSKSLCNFECIVDGVLVPRVAPGESFPYCGLEINPGTLEISRAGGVRSDTTTADALTVEYANVPGRTFRRKALNALKVQLHHMFFDTAFNTLQTALSNLYRLFHDTAERAEAYLRCLPARKGKDGGSRLSLDILKGTIEDLMHVAHTMINSPRNRLATSTDRMTKQRQGCPPPYACSIQRKQTIVIACQAFRAVFLPKQTGYGDLLDWLLGRIREVSRALGERERRVLEKCIPSLGSLQFQRRCSN